VSVLLLRAAAAAAGCWRRPCPLQSALVQRCCQHWHLGELQQPGHSSAWGAGDPHSREYRRHISSSSSSSSSSIGRLEATQRLWLSHATMSPMCDINTAFQFPHWVEEAVQSSRQRIGFWQTMRCPAEQCGASSAAASPCCSATARVFSKSGYKAASVCPGSAQFVILRLLVCPWTWHSSL